MRELPRKGEAMTQEDFRWWLDMVLNPEAVPLQRDRLAYEKALRTPADEREWALILRENHLAYEGKPPPRRTLDGKHLLKVKP